MSKRTRCLTDAQLQNRLARLEVDQQLAFLNYADPLIDRESETCLSVIASGRKSFADALAEIQNEQYSEGEDENYVDKNQEENNSPFDTATSVGKSLATISQAFTELFQTMKVNTDSLENTEANEDINMRKKQAKAKTSGSTETIERRLSKSKHPLGKKRKKNKPKNGETSEENTMATRAQLHVELASAAQEERDAIFEKMDAHGSKMDKARREQKARTEAELHKARKKKTDQDTIVSSILDKKQELDELYQQSRVRQENELKERLEHRNVGKRSEQREAELEGTPSRKSWKKGTQDMLRVDEENSRMGMFNGRISQESHADEAASLADSETSTKKAGPNQSREILTRDEVNDERKIDKKKRKKAANVDQSVTNE